MVVDKELNQVFDILVKEKAAKIKFGNTPIFLKIFDEDSKLALMASVYEGADYIPPSVRKCLTLKSPFRPSYIKTFLKLDEVNYQISLHYIGQPTSYGFKDLLEEFNFLAEEWRLFLDEHDRNDLIHVRVK